MNFYKEIKNRIIENEAVKRVKDYSKNRSDLQTYYNVGKLLRDAGKHYGEGIIKEYSKKLTEEFGKGYTTTRLKYFRRFYVVMSKRPTVSDLLSFSHYCEIIWFEEEKINYYIKKAEDENLSVRELRKRIKSNEYERLPEKTKNKLIKNEVTKVDDFIKNPIVIRTKNKTKEIFNEKILQKLILEDIPSFLEELGNGFTFIKNEYKIKIGNRYNYIDLLLFNYEFNCFVVVELKVTELKKEHIGQIEIYMNYINNNLRKINQDKTIGIIICKKENKFLMEYCSDERIMSKEYKVLKT